jgi:uncharacterized protein YbjT (DUF2867 family)
MSVWVEGATGKAGRRVVEALAAAGIAVRAASRHPGEPSPGVRPVRFDWYDPTTWSAALGDADALFVKGLDSDDNAGQVFARLLASAPAVRRVVLMSAMSVDRSPPDAPRHAVERAVQNSGKEWTILRPNWLLQNFSEDEAVYARAIREDDELYAGSGDQVVSFVDARDVADVAVTVLSQDGHHQRGYTLTGPEAVTFGDVATELSRASGRPVRHIDANLAEHRAHFARSGRPDTWVDHMMYLFELIRTGAFAAVTEGVQQLTGNSPRTLAAYSRAAYTREARVGWPSAGAKCGRHRGDPGRDPGVAGDLRRLEALGGDLRQRRRRVAAEAAHDDPNPERRGFVGGGHGVLHRADVTVAEDGQHPVAGQSAEGGDPGAQGGRDVRAAVRVRLIQAGADRLRVAGERYGQRDRAVPEDQADAVPGRDRLRHELAGAVDRLLQRGPAHRSADVDAQDHLAEKGFLQRGQVFARLVLGDADRVEGPPDPVGHDSLTHWRTDRWVRRLACCCRSFASRTPST